MSHEQAKLSPPPRQRELVWSHYRPPESTCSLGFRPKQSVTREIPGRVCPRKQSSTNLSRRTSVCGVHGRTVLRSKTVIFCQVQHRTRLPLSRKGDQDPEI